MTQSQGTQVSMDSVIQVQREKIALLTEENIMLLAALKDKERQIVGLQQKKD